MIALMAPPGRRGPPFWQKKKRVPELAVLAGARITLIDGDGAVLADSDAPRTSKMDNHLNRPEIPGSPRCGVRERRPGYRQDPRRRHPVRRPSHQTRQEKITGYVRLARPLTGIQENPSAIFLSRVPVPSPRRGALLDRAFLSPPGSSTPFRKWSFSTRKLQEGEIPGTLLIHSTDEVGRLARNINYMVMELQESARVANEEKNKLEAAFASMTDGVLVLDNEDRIEAMNGAFKSLLGIRRRDILGKTLIEADLRRKAPKPAASSRPPAHRSFPEPGTAGGPGPLQENGSSRRPGNRHPGGKSEGSRGEPVGGPGIPGKREKNDDPVSRRDPAEEAGTDAGGLRRQRDP
jgi:hypothetical protein